MAKEIFVEGHRISDNDPCYVIAEIGANHMGSLENAKQMFLSAKRSGVSAVKLQKRDNSSLFTKDMYNMSYVNNNSFGDTYGEHREAVEFGKDEYRELQRYAKEIGLTMFATPFDIPSADFLRDLDMPAYKTASADITNTPLLKHIASFGKPMFVSTGAATMEDVERAYNTIMPINQELCILQCTSSYPVEPDEMNLKVIQTYKDKFKDIVIGLSDHQNGIAMALVGYVLGARVIEKHFTINRSWKGTDQPFSLEESGLQKLVRDLERASIAFGDGIKRPFDSEKKTMYKLGKKLVAANDMPIGHIIEEDDLAVKIPNDGLPPYEIDKIVGKKITRNVMKDENISFDYLV
ncbi:MAG: N-acetylneuraminate synthase [SAR202 cluster bacterium]|nr:N-acetylneuraminate synthase [Chloroflexota bacterium]MQG22882.1 N-acetylneuraminate synthase [SAR202 cluster bacterium]|tara:strand:- start:7750 stop:8799 length:1050 start_codon:yes stop_codon:yes gene_type:complete